MEGLLQSIDVETLTQNALALGTNVLMALLILIFGLWISGKVDRLIIALSKNSEHLDETLFKFLGSIARYVLMAFVFLAVLNRFGIETTSIVAMFGAATLAVGLALQGAMSNLAAGVMLIIFRPYKTGDFIDAAGRFGLVEEVNLFTTVLKTFDNQQIIVPNSKIWGDDIINHSHHPIRGVDMHFGVAYGEDLDKTRAVIKQVLGDHDKVLKDPPPFIEVETLNDSSVDFLVRPFCEGAHYFDLLYSIPEKIKVALDAANIEIPYPHQKIILVKED